MLNNLLSNEFIFTSKNLKFSIILNSMSLTFKPFNLVLYRGRVHIFCLFLFITKPIYLFSLMRASAIVWRSLLVFDHNTRKRH